MQKINEVHKRSERSIKVLQFGEGNFLRGFVDYGIDVANEQGKFNGDVAIVKPRQGDVSKFKAQDNVYTVILRGIKNGEIYEGERVVTCVQKVLGAYEDYDAFMGLAKLDSLEFVVSNTTEAGIVFDAGDKLADCPAKTYPAKLTKFLYERFSFYKGDANKGLIMLPVELIEDNGEVLRETVFKYADLWQLGDSFKNWLETANVFAGTLVDRIITGYPADKIEELSAKWGYEDPLAVMGEPFGLWVIEADASVAKKFDISTDGLSVDFTDKLKFYKERKVRILNGAHTSSVLGGYLSGLNYVQECMEDSVIRKEIEKIVMEEVVPTVHLPREKAAEFARFVFERFENPFVKHALLSISLNSVSKWRARVLPTIKDIFARDGKLPTLLTFSFAALVAFYRTTEMKNGCLIGKRGLDTYEISDDPEVLAFFQQNAGKDTADLVALLAAKKEFWGEDLGALGDFVSKVTEDLKLVEEKGMKEAILQLC